MYWVFHFFLSYLAKHYNFRPPSFLYFLSSTLYFFSIILKTLKIKIKVQQLMLQYMCDISFPKFSYLFHTHAYVMVLLCDICLKNYFFISWRICRSSRAMIHVVANLHLLSLVETRHDVTLFRDYISVI